MKSQFDPIADVYDASLNDVPYRRFVEVPTVLGMLGDVAGLRVLDLGSGSGIYSRLLARRGAAVVGVDQSGAMVEAARRTEADEPLGIRYVLGDAQTDRSVTGACDVVLGIYLLPYAPTFEALRSMCDTARIALAGSGGRFVGVTANPDTPVTTPGYHEKYGVEIATEDGSRPRDGDVLRGRARAGGREFEFTAYYWSRDTYERALREAGFARVEWVSPRCGSDADAALYADFLARPHLILFVATL